MHVDNHDLYLCAKNKPIILCLYFRLCKKRQISKSEMVNSYKFKNLPAGQYFTFLCRSKYKLYHIEILHVHKIRYWQHLEFYIGIFETLKC
jgi:hypothetical protein